MTHFQEDASVQNDDVVDSHDDIDVQEALGRYTDDGPGDDQVPDSDFVSYEAGEDVTAYKQEDSA